jgi:hypothetical protein
LVFTLSLYLGLHLRRERRRGALPAAGPASAALLLLALTLVLDALGDPLALATGQAGPWRAWVARIGWALRAIAPALWLDAALALVPPGSTWHERLRVWRRGLLPAALVFGGWVAGSQSVLRFDGPDLTVATGPLWPLYVVGVAGAAILALLVLWLARREIGAPYSGVLLAGTIFLGMSLFGLLTAVSTPMLAAWATVAVGADLLLLGVAIEALDAFEAGERRGARVLREATAALLPALLVGAQIGWVARMADLGTAGVLLLYGALATVIVTPTLLARTPSRGEIGDSEPAEPGAERNPPAASTSVDPSTRPDRESFGRQVRRALSAAGDLPRLASSPLVAWVPPAGLGTPAERAKRLRQALVRSIEGLRPEPTAGADVTSPAWRHFHVLHLPYVRGVRLSSRDALPESLDAAEATAVDWLRREVPERTFFRWQSAAAALVADDLWARWWPDTPQGDDSP